MKQLFKDRNFMTFWFGEFISVVGDHISVLAFPMLVLAMTDSPALVGAVLAVQGLPRAILLLFGGAVVDRYSPRAVMLVTNVLRFIFIMFLSWLIYADLASIELVFAVALAFGIADAFFYPATTSILPSLVKPDELQGGNALVQMGMYLAVVFGPVIGGIIIAGEINTMSHSGDGFVAGYDDSRIGFARAFFIDGLTFAVSFCTLLFVKTRKKDEGDGEEKTSMLQEVKEALLWVWNQPAVRLGFIGIAVLQFFFQAPIFVGLPALAKERFVEWSYVYGLQIAAYGGGAFIGSMIGGMMRGPKPENLLRAMFLIFIMSGSTLALVVLYEPYQWAMFVFFLAGAGDSWVWVHFTTWLQKRTPEKLLGRVMSIFMFMAVGLLPIANMVMGLAFEWNLEASLIIASAIIVLTCLVAALHPDARKGALTGKEA